MGMQKTIRGQSALLGRKDVTAEEFLAAGDLEKIREYLAAGTSMVIVADPGTRSAQVHRSDRGVQVVDDKGALKDQATPSSPAFACPSPTFSGCDAVQGACGLDLA